MEEQPVVSYQLPQTPPEPKHRSFLTNKLFLITLAIVVLFTIIYAGIYLYLGSPLDQISKSSQTPLPAETSVKEGDPTANWKTYKNKWISFKFPLSWQIKEVNTEFNKNIPNNSTFFVMRINSPDYKDNGGYDQYFKMEGISLSVTGNDQHVFETDPNRTTPYKPIRSSENYFYNYLPESARNQNFFLTDINGTKFVLQDLGFGGGTYVTGWAGSFYRYPYVFEFRFTVPNNRKDESKNILTQILSTFKFLDQSPSATCIPRPACLDAVPRCLMPESENMCPPKPMSSQVVCTQDAKQCPDGSYVSRQPPNCEFVACP